MLLLRLLKSWYYDVDSRKMILALIPGLLLLALSNFAEMNGGPKSQPNLQP